MKKDTTGGQEAAMQDPLVYEQRYLPRWEMDSRAYYRTKSRTVIAKTQTKDLSVGGTCLYVAPEVHPSQKLKLKIFLSDKVNFDAEGIVLWKRTTSDHHCFAGVAFEHLPDETQQLILAYAFEANYLKNTKDKEGDIDTA